MLKKLCILLAVWFVSTCHAGTGSLVVAGSRSASPAQVRIEVPADYVVLPIAVSSDDKDPLRNLENIQATKARLAEMANKTSGFRVRYGVQSMFVSPRDDGSYSSYASGSVASSADIYLIAPLAKDRDPADIVRDLAAFLRSFQKMDQVRLRVGAAVLGLDDPEQYRGRLLALIAKEVERHRSAIGNSKSFEVSGLESPVLVQPQDERNVVLFIPFRLKVGQ